MTIYASEIWLGYVEAAQHEANVTKCAQQQMTEHFDKTC